MRRPTGGRRLPGRRRVRPLAGFALAAGLALSGCGTDSAQATARTAPSRSHAAPSTATITLISLPTLGQVLADGSGHALYMFPPDASQRVSCTGDCADDWPPEDVPKGASPVAGPGVRAALLDTLPDPNSGGRVVTYAGHPLYRYVGDPHPHTANGQAMFDDGGPWYVLAADGKPVTAPTTKQ